MKTQWISIKEDLPETEQDVLIYDQNYGIVTAWFDGSDFRFELGYDEVFVFETVTHWMPLPEKPKAS